MSANKGVLLSEERGEDWKFTASSSTSVERRISLTWTLEKFSNRPSDRRIRSPSFYFLSSEWCLILSPGHSITGYLRMENPRSEIKVKGKMSLKDRNDDHCVQNFESYFSVANKERACNLIYRTTLFERQKELLYEDVLTLYCEISTTHNVDRGMDRSTITDTEDLAVPKCIQVFFDDMKTLLNGQKSCDVTLRVGDIMFRAHKLLLGARSKVFAAMFQHDTEESRSGTVTISDMDVELVSELLKYVYYGQVKDMSVEKAIGLYSAANKYAMMNLKDQCSNYLKKNFSEENICDIALMADAHNDGMLIDCIKVFVRENTSVLHSEQWKRLVDRNPRLAYEFSISLIAVLLTNNSDPRA